MYTQQNIQEKITAIDSKIESGVTSTSVDGTTVQISDDARPVPKTPTNHGYDLFSMKIFDRLLGSRLTSSWKTTEGQTKFGYDALENAGKRKQTGSSVYREDYYTKGNKHDRLQENAADLTRNLSLASWMVRRHLDYVSQFNFKAVTGSKELDDQIETLMAEASGRMQFDLAGKFGREKMFRLAEARRVLDGDTCLIKMQDGRMQGLQADLLANPPDTTTDSQWINGVQVSRYGRPQRFGVYARNGYTGTNFVREIQAKNVIHYGFFDRYAQDQVRGVSPLVAGLNPLRDVYENFTYALLKAKVSQLFAFSSFLPHIQTIADTIRCV